jgi:FlaA1/EpsC-like NDP-sugar epimerase
MFSDDLSLLGRKRPLFENDYSAAKKSLQDFFGGARVLVVGGAGSIGREVVKLLAGFPLAALCVVDCSENNLVELTRDFRSSIGYIKGETSFLPLDVLDPGFDAFMRWQKPFDIILNFSAMKHVRSEKDPWSLMRMIDINIFAAKKLMNYATEAKAKKYFCVSTDKAQNPANLMGATKRIMECFLGEGGAPVSTARFANVAFSDGSLLYGFQKRLEKRQPLSAPSDVRRYFMTGPEAGILCLMSIALGQDKEIFFPVLDEEKETSTFSDIALKYLKKQGYEPLPCASEDEARAAIKTAPREGKWPCHIFKSDTTGEKYLEEFCGEGDTVNRKRYKDIGVIEGLPAASEKILRDFEGTVFSLKKKGTWTKADLVTEIEKALPGFRHQEKGKSLDEKM